MPDGHWIDLPLSRLAHADVAVPVRFGEGQQARMHRVILRFGGSDGDHLAASVLAEDGERCLVARDAIAWDSVTRTFCVRDAEALREVADRIDLATALCGGLAGVARATMAMAFAVLGGIFSASPIIFGGIGTLIAFWFLKALALWLLLHWVIWFVAIPCCLVFAVCEGVAIQRVAKLHEALLQAAANSLQSVQGMEER